MLYDVTTLYFEAEKEDRLRKVGYSKERRVDPQIVVGLLVDRAGFLLRSAASKATKPKPPRSCRSSKPSNSATIWPTWSWSPTPGCSRRRTWPNSTPRTCGSSSVPRMTKAPIDLASHFPLARAGLLRWTDHRHPHPTGRAPLENNELLRAEPVWDPRGASGVVAGGVAYFAQTPCATTPL